MKTEFPSEEERNYRDSTFDRAPIVFELFLVCCKYVITTQKRVYFFD